MANNMIVGVDVGGTFTDLVALGGDGAVRIAKVPSTADNQARGVLAALAAAGIDLGAVEALIHGTTTTTNALLERNIARTGLITTQGFRDVLELGRRTRPQPYGMVGEFEPLIPREWRLEVAERMDAEGRVVTPLDEPAVESCARRLLDQGCEAVVIHFLHCYANPAHEERAGEIVRRVWPNSYVVVGHQLLCEFREFERGTTAAVNAAIQPVLDRYVSRLQNELRAGGFASDLLVMQGNGGMVPAGEVAREAAKTVMSGPASGVMAAAFIGQAAGYPSLITYDMGGTSSDVALVRGGVPAVSDELELEYGMPIHVPMVDVHSIGAGGGSIARIDDGGLLRVGPQSAGADPGPVCYGRGGDAITITDANLLLGRLDPAGLLSVDGRAPVAAVRQAMQQQIAAPLGLTPEAAAEAVLRIANDRMAGAIRMVSLARGHDPRDYALFAFGGAGPLHATALARELGVPKVLIPTRPGITNAIGCVVADSRHDFTQTLNADLADADPGELAAILDRQAEAGRTAVARAPVAIAGLSVLHSADMQFRGQTHTINVPLHRDALDAQTVRARFDAAYLARFGIALPEMTPVIVNLRTSVVGKRGGIDASMLDDDRDRAGGIDAALKGTRRVWFDGDWLETRIIARNRLPIGAEIRGPAILEQLDTTIVIAPQEAARVDAMGNLIVNVPGRPATTASRDG